MANSHPRRGPSFAAKALYPSLLVLVVFVVATVCYLDQNRDAETWVLWLMGAGAVSLATLLATLVTWRVTQPLRVMRDTAEAIGQGDFHRRVTVGTGDELGQLADALNRMTQNLQLAQHQLDRTITDLKTTREHLTQAQKLTAIGEFIAGIAHDLNNPLTSVTGFAQLLQKADAEGRHARHTEQILKASQRCSRIVSQLLAFSRRHQPERRVVNLHDVIQAALEIISPQLRASSIELVFSPAPTIPLVMADPHQFQEVFVNLVNNARQAIESHRPSGRVQVSTQVDAEHVTVHFEDDGPGIPAENLERIFEPFYTTKPEGKGTGLGLSLASGIVQEHGGRISVQSTVGQGTRFSIQLPLAQENAPDLTRTITAAPQALQPPTHSLAGQRVLAIDDDEDVREMLAEMLTASGCEVDTAADGRAALELLLVEKYDAVICDLCLPGLTGRELYEQLCASQHALRRRFVFITGDVTAASRIAGDPLRPTPCLTKPLDLAQVVLTLAQLTEAAALPAAKN